MIDQNIINNIKQICSCFLFEHGGMENGYCTYIDGSTEQNNEFLITTPTTFDMTRHQVIEISNQLKDLILKYLVEVNLNCIIKFESNLVEYGCYDTYIEFVYPAGRLF